MLAVDVALHLEETVAGLVVFSGFDFFDDEKKAIVDLFENINQKLEINLNKEAPTAIT